MDLLGILEAIFACIGFVAVLAGFGCLLLVRDWEREWREERE